MYRHGGLGSAGVQSAVLVQVGRLRYRPQQRLLSSEETLAILQEYPRCHPFRARFLLPLLMSLVGVAYDGTPEGLCALSQILRGVAWRPQEQEEESPRDAKSRR